MEFSPCNNNDTIINGAILNSCTIELPVAKSEAVQVNLHDLCLNLFNLYGRTMHELTHMLS